MTTALVPQYSNVKSFYNKALVHTKDNGDLILSSYTTAVCTITYDGKIIINNLYSRTTTRHIVEFLRQNATRWSCHYPDIKPNKLNTAILKRLINGDDNK